jgi:beta-lactamase regulating signal transducer with metallopeptidase domain
VETLFQFAVSNTLMAACLGLVAALVALVGRRPALAHGFWLLVLVKLLTPPLVDLAVLPTLSTTETAVVEPVPEPTKDALGAGLLTPPSERPKVSLVHENAGRPAVEEAAGSETRAERERDETAGSETRAKREATEAAGATRAELAMNPPSSGSTAEHWKLLAIAAWFCGTVGYFVLAALRIRRFHRLIRRAPAAAADLQAQADEFARRLGLTRCPQLRVVPGAVPPMLWSLGQPLLIVPAELWQRLDDDQRAALLVHELAHLRRRDHWIRFLEFLATGLWWWNPLLWWARHGLREAEEACCDAWVVWALPDHARAYALALVETVDFLSQVRPAALPAAGSGFGETRILKRRLTMIMQGTTPRSLSSFGLLALLVAGLALLPLVPTWAQEKERPASIEDVAANQERAEQIKKLRAQLETIEMKMAQARQQVTQAQIELLKMEDLQRAMQVKLRELGARGAGREFRFEGRSATAETRRVRPGEPEKAPPGREFKGRSATAETVVVPASLADARAAIERAMAQRDAKLAELEEAKANLQFAEAKLRRFEALAAKKAVGEEEITEARAKVAVSQARVKAHEAGVAEANAVLKRAQEAAEEIRRSLLQDLGPARPSSEQNRLKVYRLGEGDGRDKALEKKLEEMDRKIKELEKRLEQGKPFSNPK